MPRLLPWHFFVTGGTGLAREVCADKILHFTVGRNDTVLYTAARAAWASGFTAALPREMPLFCFWRLCFTVNAVPYRPLRRACAALARGFTAALIRKVPAPSLLVVALYGSAVPRRPLRCAGAATVCSCCGQCALLRNSRRQQFLAAAHSAVKCRLSCSTVAPALCGRAPSRRHGLGKCLRLLFWRLCFTVSAVHRRPLRRAGAATVCSCCGQCA